MRAIAYYRTRHVDPKASGRAIVEQRNIVGAWRVSQPDHEVVAEYTEDESDLGPRHALRSAVHDCKVRDTFLLIASTEAIGQGQPFHPRIFSVPFIKLPTPQRALGYIKEAPLDAPEGLSLYFDNHAEGTISDIYLCNGTDHCIESVTATLVGTTADLDRFQSGSLIEGYEITTSTETRHVQSLRPGQMSLISRYDAIFDGDFLLICDLAYRIEVDAEPRARVVVDKGHSGQGFVRLRRTETTSKASCMG